MSEPDQPDVHCPEHGLAEREKGYDPNGDWTGDYYCGVLGCDWLGLVGWGYDGDTEGG